MKSKRQLKAFLGVGAGFFIIFATMAVMPTLSAAKLPSVLTITCYPVGSFGTIMATALSDVISKKTGIRTRPTPADADMARLLPIKNGEAQATLISAATVYMASTGKADFSKKMWGPQRLRYIFAGHKVKHGFAAKANSGIKNWADLKGKRVAIGVGVNKMTVPGFLAYGGLSLDDVTVVPAGGYIHSIKTVMSGGADACHLCPSSSITKEWEASPYGLRFLPMDNKDKAAWERLAEFAPFMASPAWTTAGALGEGGPKWLAYYPYTVCTYDTVPEEIIYTMTKAIVEGYDMYKNVRRPFSEEWNIDMAMDLSKPVHIPYHTGFIKLAKEMGKWKAEHDDFQAKALKAEEERIKNYKFKK
jgi:TRAP transporter TAXI family solute receptor